MLRACERAEELVHFAVDTFGVAEHAAPLGDPHGTHLASPFVYALKQVAMNCAIVCVVECASRECFGRALERDLRFERIKGFLVPETDLVDKGTLANY
jgi:hypothetical protein